MMWATGAISTEEHVLLELNDWDCIVIAVYSNRPQNIFGDRDGWYRQAKSPSVLLQGVPLVKYAEEDLYSLLKQNRIRFIVIKSQPVKDRLNDLFYVHLVEVVDNYGLYRVAF
jgi:hypothetical protein